MRRFFNFGLRLLRLPGPRSRRLGRPAQTRELATQGQPLDRVVAIVNDGVVLNSDLDAEVSPVSERLHQQKLELPPQNVLRQQVLERLVLQEIQVQSANNAGVKVSDENVNTALEDSRKRNGMTLSQLPEALAKQGIDYSTYREEIRREIILNLLRQRDVLQHINVTPREIDLFLDKQAKTPSAQRVQRLAHPHRRGPGGNPGPGGGRPPSAPPMSTSAPRAARTSPSSRSPIPTARPPSTAARSAGARAASCRPSSPTWWRSLSPAR